MQTKPESVRKDYLAVPKNIITQYKLICLAADLMFVVSVPFLITTSRGIKFITAKHIPVQTVSQLKHSLICIMQLYDRASFTVQTILVDGQFKHLKGHLTNTVVNTAANTEHVGDVE